MGVCDPFSVSRHESHVTVPRGAGAAAGGGAGDFPGSIVGFLGQLIF